MTTQRRPTVPETAARAYQIFLERPSGSIMLMLFGPEEGFPAKAMEAFLKSIQ